MKAFEAPVGIKSPYEKCSQFVTAADLPEMSEQQRHCDDRHHEWKGDGKAIVNWGKLTLTNGHYRYPKCGEFELRFGTNVGGHGIMMWD